MFSLFSRKKQPRTARINTQAIAVNPNETLLQAALRQGIEFPHNCRVGGCAVCKCKLVSGKVKELTESSYVLSGEELQQGYILACQSVPKTDISIEVNMAKNQVIAGQVIGQQRLTHDIVDLRIQLDTPLQYKAGQYADISIATLPGIKRSYSFATPARADGQISFFVRKVPGGKFSSLLNDADVIGQRVEIEGPFGEFWLKPGSDALLMIAGGSGLAPILAMLQEALTAGVSRPVVLLFGARGERDLYAQSELKSLASAWLSDFRYVPILSAVSDDEPWQGARGMVTEILPDLVTAAMHTYLCGPPAMIDSATELLTKLGVAREHIHADRFTSSHADIGVAV
jgi:NAD(P)H-flavin reductase/ferredoxin